MFVKKIVAITAAGIFFLTSTGYAATRTIDRDSSGKNYTRQISQKKNKPRNIEEEIIKSSPEVDKPFADAEKPPEPKIIIVSPPEPVKTETPSESLPEEVEGLEFLMYNENGVMAFAVIADHEKYQLRPALAQGKIPGRATAGQIGESLDDIALINASYFSPDGSLIGVTKIDGLTAGTSEFVRSAIGINADGTTVFGRINYSGIVSYNGADYYINGVDCERGENTLIVYNRWQGETTRTNDFGVELVVDGGIISEIFRDKGNNFIPPNGYIVSAHGTAAEIFENAQVGDPINFSEYYNDEDGAADFNSAIHVLGAGPRLVRDGEVYVTAELEQFPSDIRFGRAPRSAVGVTRYGDYIFAVVDGRQAHSRGCTLQEWAEILQNNFGAVNAINLDGGGSSELLVKGDLVNSPSDGRERPIGSALVILAK